MADEIGDGASRRDLLRGGAFGMGALVGAMGVAGAGVAEAATPGFRAAATASASQHFFLKLAGIDGPSTTKGFEKQIPVHAYAWGISTPTGGAGGGGAGKATAEPFVVSMATSKASPSLALHVCKGTHIATGMLTGLKPNAKGVSTKYLTITLDEIFVSSLHQSESSGGAPLDTVHFSFAKIEYTVDGHKMTWNFKTNTTN